MNLQWLRLGVLSACLVVILAQWSQQQSSAAPQRATTVKTRLSHPNKSTAYMLAIGPGHKIGTAIELVTPTNRDWPLLAKQQQTLRAHYAHTGVKPAIFSVVKLKSETLKRLFPAHRFYVITWAEAPAGKQHIYGLGYDLNDTFAIGPSATSHSLAATHNTATHNRDVTNATPSQEQVTRVSNEGDWTDFGRFLAQRHITIQTRADARRVWNAACDAHVTEPEWYHRDLRQVAANHWELGIATVNGYRYSYSIALDANHRVLAAKLHADPVKHARH